MKRHPALVALSHDHHQALAAVRRLRTAADGEQALAEAIATFTRFFAEETASHFRDEEENVFPLVAERHEAQPLLARALIEHQRLRALVRRLEDDAEAPALIRAIAELFEAHVRLEEGELFPLIERLAADEPARLEPEARGGPVWGRASADLNATLLAWGAGHVTDEHVNAERDVLVFVLDGSVTLAVDDEEHVLGRGEAFIVAKGARRRLTAGPRGVSYLSTHLRRPPLQISRPSRGDSP